METFPVQIPQGRSKAYPLRSDRGYGRSRRPQMAATHQNEIQHDVQRTSQGHEIERRARISQSAQNTAHDIISYNKRNAQRTNPQIGFRIGQRLGRSVHQLHRPAMKSHHQKGQYRTDCGKQPDGGSDNGRRFPVIFRSRGDSNQHSRPRSKPEDDARHSLHHLTSDGHGGHTRSIVILPHHKQVGSSVECLKHIGQ